MHFHTVFKDLEARCLFYIKSTITSLIYPFPPPNDRSNTAAVKSMKHMYKASFKMEGLWVEGAHPFKEQSLVLAAAKQKQK